MTDNPQPHQHVPEAHERRRHFSVVWLIPLIVGVIVAFLAIRSVSTHGPEITISFRTATGLLAGQTSVKYKSVVIGTVQNISLKQDRTGVEVKVRMAQNTNDLLTDHAKFWVQKPNVTTNISDIVSGTYIELDPGDPGGDQTHEFVGLETPPPMPAEQAGTEYTLQIDKTGPINSGTPIFFRDINVGEVLGVEFGKSTNDPLNVHIQIHAPYDRYVKAETRFWKVSSLNVKFGPGGLQVEFQSLQSFLEGGLAFSAPPNSDNEPQAAPNTVFQIYDTRRQAETSSFSEHISYVTYIQSAVKDLGQGSAVTLFGIQVGQVTETKLSFDPATNQTRVRVAFEVEPERAFGHGLPDQQIDAGQIMDRLIKQGLRVKVTSTNLILGPEALSLEYAPHATDNVLPKEGDALVLPGVGDVPITDALNDIANKLHQIPFDQIGDHLNHLVAQMDQNFGGEEMKQTMHSLAQTMQNAQDITSDADKNLKPALQRLPDISAQLQTSVANANQFMNSVNAGYGDNSDFQLGVKRTLDEVDDAARSIRLLADFLERHPEALVSGKSGEKSK